MGLKQVSFIERLSLSQSVPYWRFHCQIPYLYYILQPAPNLYSQARAKLELREEATEQDARNVVEIMKFRYHVL